MSEYWNAVECLKDVVSHNGDLIAGLEAAKAAEAVQRGLVSKERPLMPGEFDGSYWDHQIKVVNRMKAQAENALSWLNSLPLLTQESSEPKKIEEQETVSEGDVEFVNELVDALMNAKGTPREPILRSSLSRQLSIMTKPTFFAAPDEGPWEVSFDNETIISHAEGYEVKLTIRGEFKYDEEKRAYATDLASRLNRNYTPLRVDQQRALLKMVQACKALDRKAPEAPALFYKACKSAKSIITDSDITRFEDMSEMSRLTVTY